MLIQPTGRVVYCCGHSGHHKEPPVKMLPQITPALAIELQTLQKRRDGRRDPAFLAAGQLPAGSIEQLQIIPQ
ncbi:MAG: hypothetical protein JSS02_17290 [Planctomycetes bacterium]|nr:hypothetical protein [Planctomycetota bacterium]